MGLQILCAIDKFGHWIATDHGAHSFSSRRYGPLIYLTHTQLSDYIEAQKSSNASLRNSLSASLRGSILRKSGLMMRKSGARTDEAGALMDPLRLSKEYQGAKSILTEMSMEN